VHRYLSRQVPNDRPEPLPTRLLFALLYFADQASAVRASRRLAALQPLYPAIEDAGLSAYFRFLAERILHRETDNAQLEEAMWSLTGCEAMQLAEPLAGLAIAALERNAGEDDDDLFATLFDFLERNTAIVERQYADRARAKADEAEANADSGKPAAEASERDDGWRRSFFREWVLHHFCAVLIDRQGPAAYEVLLQRGWYARDARIHHRIRHEMEREASIAFGWWFRSNRGIEKKHKEYLSLTRKLSQSAQDVERIRAFYLMLHTVPKRMRGELCMDRDFQPILRGFLADATLARHLERSRDFVEFNLSGACS
jgi:hypothetical protein